VLTHLLGQDITTLAEKISAYRNARSAHGHDASTGTVSLMLHAYIGEDLETVKSEVRTPFREYLRSAISLEREAALGGGVISGGKHMSVEEIARNHMDELLDLAFERYFRTSALMGTPHSCIDFVRKLEEIGVNEIACLIDFGLPTERVLQGMRHLDLLREACSSTAASQAAETALQEFAAEL